MTNGRPLSGPDPSKMQAFLDFVIEKVNSVRGSSETYHDKMMREKAEWAYQAELAQVIKLEVSKSTYFKLCKSFSCRNHWLKRSQGNNLLKEGKFLEAFIRYTVCIALDPYEAVYFLNRTAVALLLKE